MTSETGPAFTFVGTLFEGKTIDIKQDKCICDMMSEVREGSEEAERGIKDGE